MPDDFMVDGTSSWIKSLNFEKEKGKEAPVKKEEKGHHQILGRNPSHTSHGLTEKG